MKIRTRLFITATGVLLIGLYALVNWIVKDVRLHYFITMEESLVDTSVLLAEQLTPHATSVGIEITDDFRNVLTRAAAHYLDATIYKFTKTNMNLRVVVVDRNLTVLYDSRDATEGQRYDWRDARLTLDGKYGARATYEIPNDRGSFYFYVAAPILVGDEIIGSISVGKPVSSITPFMRQARTRLILSGVIAFMAILLLLIPVSLWIVRPLRALTTYARNVRDGGKPARPNLGGGEIGELATAFEEMRDTLEGRQYVEEYVQSLTHEMKSPLAAIHGAAELLAEEMPPPQRARFLKNIRTEARRMHELVSRLLALTALEKKKEPVRCEPIDLTALLDDVTAGLRPLLQSKNRTIQCIVDPETPLRGDHFLLRQAIANLVHNAVDFSPVGGTIEIRVGLHNDATRFEIIDQGPGIPDYARARVFERFYSLARPDGGPKSSGLGLNFVREIAVLHRGDVSLSNLPKGGACAILHIPRNP